MREKKANPQSLSFPTTRTDMVIKAVPLPTKAKCSGRERSKVCPTKHSGNSCI